MGPLLKLVQVSLDGIPSFCCIPCSTVLKVFCKVVETTQPIPYPLKVPPFISSQCRERNVLWDHIKGPAEVQADDINCISLAHRRHHSVIKGHQTGQAQSALGEAMLVVLDHPLVP